MNRLPWFTHDANAHKDADLRALIRKHGHRADTIYWCLIEELWTHGHGNTARIALSDLANTAITSPGSVLKVLETLGVMAKVSSKIEKTKHGVYITYEIPKLKERLKKLKMKGSSKVLEKTPKRSTEEEEEREEHKPPISPLGGPRKVDSPREKANNEKRLMGLRFPFGRFRGVQIGNMPADSAKWYLTEFGGLDQMAPRLKRALQMRVDIKEGEKVGGDNLKGLTGK